MSESESQVVRKTIFGLKQIGEQGVMYVTPLSVGQASTISIAMTPIEQSIPYAIVSTEQLSEPKRKSKRLVEVETHKSKRVNQLATKPKKRKKTLLTIEDSSEEDDEEHEVKQLEKVIVFKQSTGKTMQPQKPKIENINTTIANEGNFVQMNKFYDLYNEIEKEYTDISAMRYMILNNLKLEDIEGILSHKV